ncbi:MAG: hypothetical protein HKN36_06275 [Hellea sp.]|nr:hypothetical protein [Hellea sp.]
MNTSTSKDDTGYRKAGGAFADGLTLVRVVLTPLIMFVIIAQGWPTTTAAVLASMLFGIAALTDIFDDLTGGAETSKYRKFGWFDDIADTVLICGTLMAMLYVVFFAQQTEMVYIGEDNIRTERQIDWWFVVPAIIIIARELLVGLLKGFELNRSQIFETPFGNLKTALIMIGTCILLASPWLSALLTPIIDGAATGKVGKITEIKDAGIDAIEAYNKVPNIVWTTGLVILWIGAVLSFFTGYKLLTHKSAANDG